MDLVGIQAWSVVDGSWNGTSYAAVAGWDHVSAGDTLQLATNASSTSWSWTYLSGGPGSNVSYSARNIAEASDGTNTRIWLSDIWSAGNNFWACVLTSGSCSWVNYGRPRTELTTNDVLSGGTLAYGSVGYVTGTLGNTAKYLYALSPGSVRLRTNTEWQNGWRSSAGMI